METKSKVPDHVLRPLLWLFVGSVAVGINVGVALHWADTALLREFGEFSSGVFFGMAVLSLGVAGWIGWVLTENKRIEEERKKEELRVARERKNLKHSATARRGTALDEDPYGSDAEEDLVMVDGQTIR